ncbi:MAG TPA: PLDc N-terminal domain-containing protein [Acidothermaceae bacterium]|nr:PLDc N-terminal domain-containing protein [Acidothermaceae bacterium]
MFGATGSTRPKHTFWASAAPLAVIVLGLVFLVFCLVDLARTEAVRYVPKWAWAVVCVISVPLGGVIYLLVGNQR